MLRVGSIELTRWIDEKDKSKITQKSFLKKNPEYQQKKVCGGIWNLLELNENKIKGQQAVIIHLAIPPIKQVKGGKEREQIQCAAKEEVIWKGTFERSMGNNTI